MLKLDSIQNLNNHFFLELKSNEKNSDTEIMVRLLEGIESQLTKSINGKS